MSFLRLGLNKHKLYVYMTIYVPMLGTLVALTSWWSGILPVTSLDLMLLLSFYVLSMYGLELGFHRYFSHRSFQAKPWFAFLLAFFGTIAGQGPVAYWIGNHRDHHHNSDKEGDPHSPHLDQNGNKLGRIRGFWHAHIGWLFHNHHLHVSVSKDLIRRLPSLAMIERNYLSCVILGLVIPGLIGGIVSGTFQGFFSGFLWGGLVRLFLVQHAVWSINSVCHLWGSQPYKNNRFSGTSRNNILLAFLTLGGGWHNNHHRFPNAAFNRFQWWQVDITDLTIRFFEMLGVIWKPINPPVATQYQSFSKIIIPISVFVFMCFYL